MVLPHFRLAKITPLLHCYLPTDRADGVVLHALFAALSGHFRGVMARRTRRLGLGAHTELAAGLAGSARAGAARVPHPPRVPVLGVAGGGGREVGN